MFIVCHETFMLEQDFDEVKRLLQHIAEQFLPTGTPYCIRYDPHVQRLWGRVKCLMLSQTGEVGDPPHAKVGEYAPPHFEPTVGLYLVTSGIARGEPPSLPTGWRARMAQRQAMRPVYQKIAQQHEKEL